MNGIDYHQRYMEAMKKLAGTGERTCQHSGCQSLAQKSQNYCLIHRLQTASSLANDSEQELKKNGKTDRKNSA